MEAQLNKGGEGAGSSDRVALAALSCFISRQRA